MRDITATEFSLKKNAFFNTTAIIKQSENLTKKKRKTDRQTDRK